MDDSNGQNEIVEIVPVLGSEALGLLSTIPTDLDPPDLDGEFLDAYREYTERYDRELQVYPEYMRTTLWILTRKVAEDFVLSRMPGAPPDRDRDRRLGVFSKELGSYGRGLNHLEAQATQTSILLVSILAGVLTEYVSDTRLRKAILLAVRREFLPLLR